ncbi:MAG: YlxR family protein [Acidimicrobiales bacterium]
MAPPTPSRYRPKAAPSPLSTRSSPISPIRTCVGCRRRRPQVELERFVRSPEGSIVEGRTLPGRGAWLCKDTLAACRERAERRGAFARAFRC